MAEHSYAKAVAGISVAGLAGPYQGKLIPEISAIEVRAARRVADGLEAMQLVIKSASISGIVEWPNSVGFEVEASPVDRGSPNSMVQIFLQLTEGRYRDVFFALCEDICSVLVPATGEKEAVRAFHSRLVRWQSFFRHNRQDGLTPEAQVGLYGELKVMGDQLLPRLDPVVVLRAWRGCKGAAQDFQFENWALEVKASRAAILDKISVSNVQQLDEDGKVPLLLTVVQLQSGRSTGETLPELVVRVRSQLDGEGLELFESGLMEVGYLDAHERLYVDAKYQVIDVVHHDVREGFPRIRRADLPEGVKKVRYDISIDAARGFRVSEAAVYHIFEGHKDGDND